MIESIRAACTAERIILQASTIPDTSSNETVNCVPFMDHELHCRVEALRDP